MRLQFIGCGDAFGSGGRYNTCFLLDTGSRRCLIDCGASSLVAMKKLGIDPNSIDAILITHYHADHFGGVPFFMLDAQLMARRTAPLLLAGPPGLAKRLEIFMETAFPGSHGAPRKYDLTLTELAPGVPADCGGLTVTGHPVVHGGEVSPYALRIEAGGKSVCYSGDTEWCDGLARAAQDADLFVAEAYFYDKPVRMHLNLKALEAHLPAIRARRLVLTHMSPDMLARAAELEYELAEDGKAIEF